MDKITTIDNKIETLRKRKAKIQTQEAVLFRREAEKIFEKDFTPDIALAVLSDWNTATETRKKEWANKSNSFRIIPPQSTHHKTEAHNSADLQKGETKEDKNG